MIPDGAFNSAVQRELKEKSQITFRLGSLLMDCQSFFWRVNRKYRFESDLLRFVYRYPFRRYIFVQELFAFLRYSQASEDYSDMLSEILAVEYLPKLGLDPYRNIINRFLPVESRLMVYNSLFFQYFANFVRGGNVEVTIATNFVVSILATEVPFRPEAVSNAEAFIEYFRTNQIVGHISVRFFSVMTFSYIKNFMKFCFIRNFHSYKLLEGIVV